MSYYLLSLFEQLTEQRLKLNDSCEMSQQNSKFTSLEFS